MNYIVFKGVKSTDLVGLIISELPHITKPQMKVKETFVDGRDGSIISAKGYSSYTKSVSIGLYGDFDIDQIIEYFSGEGELVLSNEPDKVYRACVVAQIDFTRLVRYRQATILFKVQPYKHKYNEDESKTAVDTKVGTSLVLTNGWATPISISTDATEVLVHGTNIFSPSSLDLNTNTSLEVSDDGYRLVAVGGTRYAYSSSGYILPLAMKGKSYSFKCDKIVSQQNVKVVAQIKIVTPTETIYRGLSQEGYSVTFTIPTTATEISLGIITNHSAEKLETDNVATIEGLRLVSTESASTNWCPFESVQTLSVVDGKTNGVGCSSATFITNAEGAEMTVDYFERFNAVNDGTVESKPIMTINGEGTVEIAVNGVGVFSYTFPGGEDEVVIDSEQEDAYLGAVLKNRNMVGEFPTLRPGANTITWSGKVSNISIEKRSRWL